MFLLSVAAVAYCSPAPAAVDESFDKRLKRAEGGEVDDEIAVGCAYLDGQGVEKNSAVGLKWLNLAIESGSASAAFELASRRESGKGVGKDLKEAVRLYKISGECMSALAHRELGRIYSEDAGVPRDAVQAYVHYDLAVRLGYENLSESRDAQAKELSPEQLSEAKKTAETGWRRMPHLKYRIAELNRRTFGKKPTGTAKP